MTMLFSQILDRPVFIMAAPRSGSTLLFETLIKSRGIYSIGDESHGLIEQFAPLKPEMKTPPSNMLDADDASVELKEDISRAFVEALVDSAGQPVINPQDAAALRMIEKTPKNVLRIPFFDAIYPDALFIYLYRSPLENISSIIDGWGSGRFVTYAGLQVAAGPWSFLLPPGWQERQQDSVAQLAAWQWVTSHEHALNAFSAIDRERVFALNYDDFLQQSAHSVESLCDFIGIEYDAELAQHCSAPLPLSRYTLSQPGQDKWKRNAALLADVIDSSSDVIQRINRFAGAQSSPLQAKWSKALLSGIAQQAKRDEAGEVVAQKVSRNQPCPCGSGKKYKRCHGALSSAQESL